MREKMKLLVERREKVRRNNAKDLSLNVQRKQVTTDVQSQSPSFNSSRA